MTKLLGILAAFMMTAGLAKAADAKAGKASYDKACKSCHGVSGEPNAAIAKSLKLEMRHLGAREVQALSDAELKKIVTDGVGKMRPVKSVTGAAAHDVVAYMRTFKHEDPHSLAVRSRGKHRSSRDRQRDGQVPLPPERESSVCGPANNQLRAAGIGHSRKLGGDRG